MTDKKKEVEDTSMKRNNQEEFYSLAAAYRAAYTGSDKTEAKKDADAIWT